MSPMISVFLAPGDYFVGDARHRVHTLLGSCVSITLWQAKRRLGAMSHFLLAERGPGRQRPVAASLDRAWRKPSPTENALDARYGVEALGLMFARLAELGVSPAECEAKIFGGGDMFPGQKRSPHLNVGQRNGDAARAMLQSHGIRVVSHSLFGVGHRKIVFDVATGDVWARQEDTTANDTEGGSTSPMPLPNSPQGPGRPTTTAKAQPSKAAP